MVHNMVVLYWITKMKQLQILHLYVALEEKIMLILMCFNMVWEDCAAIDSVNMIIFM